MSKKSSVQKTVNKQKKKHPLAFIFVVLFLVVGCLGGYFGVQTLTKDDVFMLIGDQTVILSIGEDYIDEGVTIIAFGQDISVSVEVEDNIDSTQAGIYYIKYTVDNLRYKGVVKYRYVIYEEIEETT